MTMLGVVFERHGDQKLNRAILRRPGSVHKHGKGPCNTVRPGLRTDWPYRCAYIRNRNARAVQAPPGLARVNFTNQLCWTFVEANHRTPGD